ncbi:MAG TPA: HEAT repeat domain-containing protein, partial [Dissulfurispiraceae bacterium]|nr:HEAT repeat domain-containing protein [Dissulfurispiraceae bacterium]
MNIVRYWIAACCLIILAASGAAVAVDPSVWIKQLRDSSEEIRSEAARGLLTVHTEESVYALAGFMDTTFMDWHLRIDIMKFLGEMALPRAVKSLATVLETEKCPALKWNAARALGRFPGNERAYQVLVDVLKDEDENQVR